MSGQTPYGPRVKDEEDVYRAILNTLQWATQENRPSSTAFDDTVFSVEIKSRTSPEATASRKNTVMNIVEFNCGYARTLEFDTRDERDDIAPDNLAHAHVYYQSDLNQRKKRARALAKSCKTVPYDAQLAEDLRQRAKIERAQEGTVGEST
jgi:hypothetical protein